MQGCKKPETCFPTGRCFKQTLCSVLLHTLLLPYPTFLKEVDKRERKRYGDTGRSVGTGGSFPALKH